MAPVLWRWMLFFYSLLPFSLRSGNQYFIWMFKFLLLLLLLILRFLFTLEAPECVVFLLDSLQMLVWKHHLKTKCAFTNWESRNAASNESFSPLSALLIFLFSSDTKRQHSDKDFPWNLNHLNFLSSDSRSFPVVIICPPCLLLFHLHFEKLSHVFVNVPHFCKSVPLINNYIFFHEVKASSSLSYCLYTWEGQQGLKHNQSTLPCNSAILNGSFKQTKKS